MFGFGSVMFFYKGCAIVDKIKGCEMDFYFVLHPNYFTFA